MRKIVCNNKMEFIGMQGGHAGGFGGNSPGGNGESGSAAGGNETGK